MVSVSSTLGSGNSGMVPFTADGQRHHPYGIGETFPAYEQVVNDTAPLVEAIPRRRAA